MSSWTHNACGLVGLYVSGEKAKLASHDGESEGCIDRTRVKGAVMADICSCKCQACDKGLKTNSPSRW